MTIRPIMNKTELLLLCAAMFLAFSTCDKRNRSMTMPDPRVDITLNADGAEAILAILDRTSAGQSADSTLWARLFTSEPYVRLKKREAEIGKLFNVPELAFTDDDFRKFVLSDTLRKQAPALRRTLAQWQKADLAAAGARALAYLPAGTRIRAKVFPMIKPHPNSFVYELDTDPTEFLFIDPEMTGAEFENTVAHEMHHVGYASLDSQVEAAAAALPPRARAAAQWIGGFGEGFAMLAAAGGPDVHPHAASPADVRARWDSDMGNCNADLREVENFLLGILRGKLKTEEEVNQKGSSFFGTQGPWYTVGYKMAVTVERKFGKDRLIADMLDPRLLLRDYNLAAADQNRDHQDTLALWSPELIKGLGLGDTDASH